MCVLSCKGIGIRFEYIDVSVVWLKSSNTKNIQTSWNIQRSTIPPAAPRIIRMRKHLHSCPTCTFMLPRGARLNPCSRNELQPYPCILLIPPNRPRPDHSRSIVVPWAICVVQQTLDGCHCGYSSSCDRGEVSDSSRLSAQQQEASETVIWRLLDSSKRDDLENSSRMQNAEWSERGRELNGAEWSHGGSFRRQGMFCYYRDRLVLANRDTPN